MMRPMLGFLLDVLTPRFIEEDVAFRADDDGNIQPLYRAEEILDGDCVDFVCVGRVRSFQFMGVAFGGRLVTECIEYRRWKALKDAGRLVGGRVRFSDWGDSQ